jgi:hypothetical protein
MPWVGDPFAAVGDPLIAPAKPGPGVSAGPGLVRLSSDYLWIWIFPPIKVLGPFE